MDYYSFGEDLSDLFKYKLFLSPDTAQQAIDNDDLEFLIMLFKIKSDYKKLKIYKNTDEEIVTLLNENNILYIKLENIIYKPKIQLKFH